MHFTPHLSELTVVSTLTKVTGAFLSGNPPESVSGIIGAFADTDPFFTFEGTFVNETGDDLDVAICFEESLQDALPPDTPLDAQVILDVLVEDTGGDPGASASLASWGMSIFATDDPDDPTLFNTEPAGARSSDFDRGTADGESGISDGETVRLESGTFQPELDLTPDGFLLSHILGDVNVNDLTHGDTVRIRGIFSVGIEGNPTFPLIPANVLEASYLAARFLEVIPEPATWTIAMGAVGLIAIRRRRTLPASGSLRVQC